MLLLLLVVLLVLLPQWCCSGVQSRDSTSAAYCSRTQLAPFSPGEGAAGALYQPSGKHQPREKVLEEKLHPSQQQRRCTAANARQGTMTYQAPTNCSRGWQKKGKELCTVYISCFG